MKGSLPETRALINTPFSRRKHKPGRGGGRTGRDEVLVEITVLTLCEHGYEFS